MDDLELHLDDDETQCQEADSILNKSSDCSQREDRHQGRQSKLKSKAEAIKEAKSGLQEIMKSKAEGLTCCKKKILFFANPMSAEIKIILATTVFLCLHNLIKITDN